ncbi:MAG: hypothetical protein M1831_000443 [Alyxoria varia]|nr:MAG: hypothetical protein M1831_000443 [Alyxoria varia]
MQSLRLCWRSTRWIHPTCHRPHIPRHILRRALSSTPQTQARRRKNHGKDDDDDRVQTNYFEQQIDNTDAAQSKRIRPVSEKRFRGEEDEDDHPDDPEMAALIKELAEEDDDLPTEMTEEEKRELFTPEQIEQANKLAEEDTGADLIAELTPYKIVPETQLPRQSTIYLKRLNQVLDEASVDPEPEEVRKQVWRWYTRSKQNVPGLLKMIPKAGWELLWLTQAKEKMANVDRASRLHHLAEDKMSAGWELSQDERYARMEGIFLEGNTQKALEIWESLVNAEDGSNPAFLEMGVRMYAHAGHLEKAHELLDNVLDNVKKADARLILPVLQAHANRGDEENIRQAWLLYGELRARLRSKMTMRDYDAVSLSFLGAQHKDCALAVFRDMMMQAEPSDSESRNLYEKAMQRIGKFMHLGGAQQVTEFSLDAIRYVPRRFQNKFFYASWLRKLIAEGFVDEAAQVVELMYERGINPDAKHINGLISAWFRKGDGESRQTGEELGWAMIQTRIDMVNARRERRRQRQQTLSEEATPTPTPTPTKSLLSIATTSNPPAKIPPTFAARRVPPATIETFCVLIKFHLHRGMYPHIRLLRNLLSDTEIPMNAFFMNHLLYAEFRTRGYSQLWIRFRVMSTSVLPDTETWIFLWDCMKRHVDSNRAEVVEGFPGPRELFARFTDWFAGLQGQARSDALADMEEGAYQDVLRCCCLSGDLPGAFVALEWLKRTFAVYPSNETVKMLLMQIARLDVGAANVKQARPSGAARRSRKKVGRGGAKNAVSNEALRGLFEECLERTKRVFGMVRKGRLEEYAGRGVSVEDMSDEVREEENHRVCLTLLYTIIRRRRRDDDGGERDASIRRAAEAMGGEGLDIEEVLALVV